MKLIKTASGKKKLRMSKKEWTRLGKKHGWLKTAQQMIQRQDGITVLIPDEVPEHITKTHSEIGKGSVFNGTPDLAGVAQTAPVAPNQRPLYKIEGASGYNLVMPIDEARQLQGAQETTAVKEEDVTGTGEMQQLTVPAIITSAPLEQFATNEAYAIILQTTPEDVKFLPSSLQGNPQIAQLAQAGTLFTLVTAFPGNPNVPKTSEWDGKWAVIIPEEEPEEPEDDHEDNLSDVDADAMTLRDAGWGTDESYGSASEML